jgi:hypothetical protein
MFKNQTILIGFCILLICSISSVSATTQNMPLMNSQTRFGSGGGSIHSQFIQSHGINLGPTDDELLNNFIEGLMTEPGSAYTPIDEPIQVKCLVFGVTSPHIYSPTIDGYYENPQGTGYVPHVTLKLLA